MSQKEKILSLLKAQGEVTCSELANRYLFHKAASRISELRAQGYDIRYTPGNTVMEGKYKLFQNEPVNAPLKQVEFRLDMRYD